ncbi:SpoU rRNA Methylase family protein [Formosa sp. Hel1_31_208]|uniref:TrmH family RNA methyltransferase n=1 Tax=Formosa sp. Hel1_31_208 TaxID=1798225 RepID=UPI00087B85F0|nr:TrmH family RNA methyltransferase [Formosa sp. Hel1_31_208]SDS32666.1 SpoU rRNA Methylase family protein [Formosa sp. Hel1_31_208]
MQLNHYSTPFNKRTFPITVICENVTNAPNIGSLFRTTDAFGVERLIFCGTAIPLGRKMTKTSRATENSVPYEIIESAPEKVLELKTKGYSILALEITSNSTSISNYTFPKHQPIALIIGDENFGISDDLLNHCDAIIHINMHGQNSSMNVVQATTVALYEITKQLS